MALVVAGLVVLAGLLAAVLPLVLDEPAPESAAAGTSALVAERDRLAAAIREVDFDRALGKIEADDHAALRATLEERALTVIERLDEEPERR